MFLLLRKEEASRAWWRTPLIPALGRQRQVDLRARGQSGPQSEFQDSQGYPPPPKKRGKQEKRKRLVYPLS